MEEKTRIRIKEWLSGLSNEEKIQTINELIAVIAEYSPIKEPSAKIQFIPISKIEPNDYNPNVVPKKELALLKLSIEKDGFTLPIVAYHDEKRDKYIIVDGFHRYFVVKNSPQLKERLHNCLPVVIIHKDLSERLASTIRHNRARGVHQVIAMGDLVAKLIQMGYSDEKICKELGMTPNELFKLKNILGFEKLFSKAKYSKAWVWIDE